MRRHDRRARANGCHGRRLAIETLERRDLLTMIRLADWNTVNVPNTAGDNTNFQTVVAAIGTTVIEGNSQRIDILALQETDDDDVHHPSGGSLGAVEAIFDALYPSTDYATSVSTPDPGDQTGFVYDTSTVSLLEAFEVPGALTHTILRGKFRPESTVGESDFYVYSIHLKSGSSASIREDRADEALILRADADSLPEGSNVLFVGDFNMQSSNEVAYANIIASGTAHMRDLAGVEAEGTWNLNPAFKHLHSQDPRVTGGTGMNDRFDIMFGTDELFDGTGVEYVDNSYRVFGNNGTHNFDGPITTGSGAAPGVLAALAAVSDHLPIVADLELISGPGVRIVETGGQTKVVEGGLTDTYSVVLNTVPLSNVTVTVQPNAQINLGAGAGVAMNLLFTPGTALTPQVLTVTAANDEVPEATHTSLISHTSVSSDSNYNGLSIEQLLARISDNDVQFLINEIDSDTPSTDVAEFVEIYDGGIGNLPLDDVTLVFFNGGATNDAAYYVFSLDGYTTDANGYFLIGNPGVSGVDATFANGTLQNGADAVALYAGAFPEDGLPTSDSLIDAIVYGTNDDPDANLVNELLQSGQTQADEGTNALNSLSRSPNGGGLPRETANFVAQTPSPGAPNVENGVGIAIVQTGGNLAVIEGGSGDSFTIQLQSVPTDDVIISLDPNDQLDLGLGTGAIIQLTFTPGNALTPQVVNVTAVNDAFIEGLHSGTIVLTVVSDDEDYDGFIIPNVSATIADNDFATPASPVAISEIMYNPGSNETRNMAMNGIAEWIEIVNTGATTVDISGWKFDDEDSGTDADWSAIPASTTLSAGQVAVFFDADFTDESTFRTEWNVPMSALVIPLTDWGSLANSPSSVAPVNEVLQLLNVGLSVMDTVNYDDSNFWPTGVNGESIYFTNLATDNNAGQNWARSTAGEDGAITPTGPTFYNSEQTTPDVGSPGVVPETEEATLPGDFNNDYFVDAADYTVWRNNVGTNFDLNGNGDENGDSMGFVDEADYILWAANYGNFITPPGGGGLAASASLASEPVVESETETAAVDEAIVVFDLSPVEQRSTSSARALSSTSAAAASDGSDLLLVLEDSPHDSESGDESFDLLADSSDDDYSDVDQFFATLDDLELAAAL